MEDEQKPLFTDYLTMGEQLAPIRRTHLGQAHFAGTGPEGKTCRDCGKWYNLSGHGLRQPYTYKGGARRGWRDLQPAPCNHSIANKATRLVPPCAKSCMFFEQSSEPPAEQIRDKRFGPRKRGAKS